MVTTGVSCTESANSKEPESVPQLPRRLFAKGHEPGGLRVASYHTYNAIKDILNVLDEEEIQFLRGSAFGKFIATADKPTFSGRFVKYLLARQLNVNKRHEAWFLFASHPVRFSLREFAIVTGLPCGKFPKPSKKRTRKNISETPYWPSLFGKLENVSVKSVIKMLKRKTVTDRMIRIKYACLALLASVLFPTTHHPKISKDHAELIKDIDQFFTYPWGRLGFNLLMNSLKKRNEVTLSQTTVSVSGFVQSIQLVMVEAVPELARVVDDHCSSESEHDSGTDGELKEHSGNTTEKPKICLSPGYARVVDEESKCRVRCIISQHEDSRICADDLNWSDEEEDEKVTNLVNLIEADFPFTKKMFKGGATRGDVERMRLAEKKEAEQKRNGKTRIDKTDDVNNTKESDELAWVVIQEMKADLAKVKVTVRKAMGAITDLRNEVASLNGSVTKEVGDKIAKLHEDLITTMKKNTVNTSVGHTDEYSPGPRQRSSFSVGGGQKVIHKAAPVVLDNTLINKRSKHMDTLGSNSLISTVDRKQKQTQGPENETAVDNVNVGNTIIGAYFPSKGGGSDEDTSFGIQSESFGDKRMSPAHADPAADELDAALNKAAPCFMHANLGIGDEGRKTVSLGPTFSLGLTQELAGGWNTCSESLHSNNCSEDCVRSKRRRTCSEPVVAAQQLVSDSGVCGNNLQLMLCAASTDFDVEDKFRKLKARMRNNFTIKVAGVDVSAKEIAQIWYRTLHMPNKIVDVLLYHIEQQFICQSPPTHLRNTIFLDSQFVALFARNVTRFYKSPRKGSFKFPRTIVDYFDCGDATPPFADRFYFPFNIDKKHWIGLCIDCKLWSLLILDSNCAFRTDAQMAEILKPVAEMFPFLLKQIGRYLTEKDLTPFIINRVMGIPQNRKMVDSGLTAVLLLYNHAMGGIELCREITPEGLHMESRKLAVMLYEENEEPL